MSPSDWRKTTIEEAVFGVWDVLGFGGVLSDPPVLGRLTIEPDRFAFEATGEISRDSLEHIPYMKEPKGGVLVKAEPELALDSTLQEAERLQSDRVSPHVSLVSLELLVRHDTTCNRFLIVLNPAKERLQLSPMFHASPGNHCSTSRKLQIHPR